MKILYYLILLSALLSPQVNALDRSNLEFSLGVVMSHFENPLIDSQTRNFLFPSVNFTYYGEKFFIDDEVGYTLAEYDDAVINLVASLNLDFIYFLDRNDSLDGLQERRPSIMGGVEALIFPLWGEFQIQILQDVVNTHQGQEYNLNYRVSTSLGDWSIVPKIGFHWKSKKLIQYYYGIDSEDGNTWPNYTPSGGLNTYTAIDIEYPIDYHWVFGGFIHFTQLASEIKRSPIVLKKHTFTAAFGIKYVF